MTSRARNQHLALVRGADEGRNTGSRRFLGPYAHYTRPELDEVEIDLDDMGILDEQSGVRKKPLAESRSVPPPIPHHAKLKRWTPLVRDPKPIDFEEVLLLHPPVSFGGDAIVPPSPGIPIFRVLVVEAADEESSVTRVVAQALELLGEFGLDLVWQARRSAAAAIRSSKKMKRKSTGEIVQAKIEEPRRAVKSTRSSKRPSRDVARGRAKSRAPAKAANRKKPRAAIRVAAGSMVVLRKETRRESGALDLATRGVVTLRRWVRAAVQRVRSMWSWLARAARAFSSGGRRPRSA